MQLALERRKMATSARLSDALGWGQELRLRRKAKGLTQDQVGHKLGTSPANISRLENGKLYNSDLVARYAALLDMRAVLILEDATVKDNK